MKENPRFTLITITGPTASGKSAVAVEVARRLGCHIISADSRQIYRGMEIGTAAPTPEQLQAVPHHFVGRLDIADYFSAAEFEESVLRLLHELARESDFAVMVGGSMMYVDAVTRGIDELPTISDSVRNRVTEIYRTGGLEKVLGMLQELDPEHYRRVDQSNPRRVMHAVEVCLQAGAPYSGLLTGAIKERPFKQVKVALTMPREKLFERINTRVDAMIDAGLEEEARGLYNFRHLNALNTVGYKEMFAYFNGEMDRDSAISRLKKNTRVYAKKQLTWLKRRPDIMPVAADATAVEEILKLVNETLRS